MRVLLSIVFLLSAGLSSAASLSLDIHTPDWSKSMQIAKVYFLPDWREKSMTFEGADCSGYSLTFCPGYKIPDPASYCPGNALFFSACICPDNFKTCELPSFGSGAQCDDKFSVCTEDITRACKLENSDYTNSCPAGTKPDTSKRCSYDSDYGACCKPDTPVCPAPYVIKEIYWCGGAFSCWNIPSENPCDWCDNAWRCVMP